MSDSIRFKRGPKSNLSVLGLGEPGLTTDPDDQRLYIGGPSGNIPIPNMNDINKLTGNFYYSMQDVNSEYNDNTPLATIIESMMDNSMLIARVAPSDTTNYPSTAYGNLTIIKSIDNAIIFYSKKNTADTICIAIWRKGDGATGFGLSQWFDISNINSIKNDKKFAHCSFTSTTIGAQGTCQINAITENSWFELTSDGKLKCLVSGKYKLYCKVCVSNAPIGKYELQFRRDNTPVEIETVNVSSAGNTTLSVYMLINGGVNQVIDVYINQSSGSSVTIPADSRFSKIYIERIGD